VPFAAPAAQAAPEVVLEKRRDVAMPLASRPVAKPTPRRVASAVRAVTRLEVSAPRLDGDISA
jgi:hypothetical protein